MISAGTIFPYIFAWIIGFFTVELITRAEKSLPAAIKGILSAGIGLGICANITFLSFILFDQLSTFFVVATNSVLCIVLGFLYFRKNPLNGSTLQGKLQPFLWKLIPIGIILFLFIPLINQANVYVHGGWDAWSVWNVKAKFLYLGGENWDNLFKPILWRSSPHYPLLLPLINVWGWIFTQAPVFYIPELTAIFFSFLVAWLLYESIKDLTGSKFAFLSVLIFLSSPFIIKQCISQYCDLIFGFYLLGGLYCLVKTAKEDSVSFAALTGILLGFLTFTKGEGLLAAGLIGILSVPYLWINCSKQKRLDIFAVFLLSGFLASTPMLYFKIFFAPDNQTFTNGLTSKINPSTWPRLKAILIYYFHELKSPKWHGLLLAIGATLLLNVRALLKKENFLTFGFLFLYFSVITVYYHVNTQFEIIWWLNVTIGRVIFAVLPVILFLTFNTLLKKK